ncbi:MAG: hypothetical protein Q7W54_15360 [Bacteroidota bacterium]|nr:hypothetical protein [Bacteroidota bacterium]
MVGLFEEWDIFITICTAPREHYFGEIVKTNTDTQCVVVVETPKLGVSTIGNIAPTATNKSKTGEKKEEWKPGTLRVIVNRYK